MTYLAIAVRPIDVAIFFSLGLLWIGGALFIVALYRWIGRYEREQEPGGPGRVVVSTDPIEAPTPERASSLVPHHAVVRPGLPHPAR